MFANGNEQQLLMIVMGIETFLMVILVLIMIWMGWRLRKVRKQFNRLMSGSRKENLDSILERLFDKIERFETEYREGTNQIQALVEELKHKKGNVGVVRFNAFANEGSDLSFSIAILDDTQTGFVMTSLYGREESRIYAKPVENGKSRYHLTDEELKAMELAASKGPLNH